MGHRILTNRLNLPETLVNAVKYDTHKQAGSISVTTLLDAPLIRFLKSQNDWESDVTDNLYALLGTALHNILERGNIDTVREQAFILTADTILSEAKKLKDSDPQKASQIEAGANWITSLIPVLFPEPSKRYIFEKTMTLDYGDHVISGTFDLFDTETGILWDYKFCSTFSFMHPESRKKWDRQLNIYAYMLQKAGYEVKGLKICAFFRDWNSHGSLKNKDYPKNQIQEIELVLRPNDRIEALINYHLNLHRDADAGKPVSCSGEDRWASGDTYAVKTGKVARAVSGGIFPDEAGANKFIEENRHRMKDLWVDKRPGVSRRCLGYCPVNKVCPQYKRELEQNKILGIDSAVAV